MDYEHDRFLYESDGNLHFGCVNPFCGHGNPALPNHYKVPIETDTMTLRLVSHENRKVTLEATIKVDRGDFKAGQKVTLEAADNLEACKKEFDRVFNPDKPRTLPRFV